MKGKTGKPIASKFSTFRCSLFSTRFNSLVLSHPDNLSIRQSALVHDVRRYGSRGPKSYRDFRETDPILSVCSFVASLCTQKTIANYYGIVNDDGTY